MKKSILGFLLLSQISFAAVAPQFQGDLLQGGRTSLKQSLKQDRVLLLCFWATWCTPCMQELKSISEKLKQDPTLPLDVLTVNVDTSETSSDVKPTMKLYQFDVPVILDPKHEIFTKYQEAKTLPYSVLIQSNGAIAKTYSGYNEELFNEAKALAIKGSNAK